MNLVLEIEYLTGVCRAARGLGNPLPDWPPQPDRVFSALVSAWGVRGEDAFERKALEWLEMQPVPVIDASACTARSAPDVFVPPNDPESSKTEKKYIRVLPEHRLRQPRRFPAARPHDPNVEITWPEVPDTEIFNSLNALASCVGYLGHSASLTRCRFVMGKTKTAERLTPARRRVYPGRLRELEDAYRSRPVRPVIRSGTSVIPKRPSSEIPQAEWLILEDIDGNMPDIRTAALVSRLLRRTFMAGYRRTGLVNSIPETVSGHAPDGSPTKNPHLSIVPMAFVGSTYANGRVFGFALIPPRGKSLLEIDGFLSAYEAVAPYNAHEQRRILTVQGAPLHQPLRFASVAPRDGTMKRSLHAEPYLVASNLWASTTPVVLDRHLKGNSDTEVHKLIIRACENAELPLPDPERIQVGKHSAIQGAPPARPSTGQPSWMRWKLPKSLESRQLVHVIIDFEQSVSGPVILGAGRFMGLGLCRGMNR